VLLSEECPITGKAVEVTMHWPDGCNALVGIALYYEGKRICPMGKGEASLMTDYLWLNDATPTWPLNMPVEKGKVFWLEILNQDTVEAHTVSAIISITEEIRYEVAPLEPVKG